MTENDRDMFVQRSGRGTPALLFVHGFACSHEDWQAQREALEGHHEVVACDLPGHGRSPGTPADASISFFGEKVASLLREPAILIGHSMGCRVVLEAARHRPASVAGLVLVDGSRVGEGDPETAMRTVRAQIERVGYRAFIDAFFAAMMLRPLVNAAHLAERAKQLPEEFGMRLFLDLVRWDAESLDGALRAVKAPLMAIQSTAMNASRKRVSLRAGETSPWLDLLRRSMPQARIEVIPGGHFIQLEAPDEVSRLIAHFATRLGSRL